MKANENIQSVILQKTEGSSSARMAWQSCMDQCRFCGMPTGLMETLIVTFESPSALKLLCKLVSEDSEYEGSDSFDVVWGQFRTLSDDSSYNESQLLESVERVLIFSVENNIRTNFRTVLGYLTCVEEFAYSSGASEPLYELVTQMIEDFGFDG